ESYDDKSMKGREKIFEVRRIYNDVNFIDEFLTPEFVERHRMYQYRRDPQTGQLRIVSRDFHRIKMSLLYQLTNMGQPFIYVVVGNHLDRGDVYVAHQYNGLELDLAKAREVMISLRRLWGRRVHLQLRLDDDMYLVSIEQGEVVRKQKISADMPPPAH